MDFDTASLTKPTQHHVLKHYLFAAVLVGLTLAVRLLLESILEGAAPLLLFVIPVAFTAAWGGWGPGIFSTLLSTIVGAYFILPHRVDAASVVRLLMFLFVGILISALNARVRATRSQLERSNALLKAVLNSTTDCIFAKDTKNRMILVNPAFLATTGKTPQQVLGKNELEWHENKEQAREIIKNDQQVMATGLSLNIEEEWDDPSGGKRYFFATKSPLYDDKGKIVGTIGISRDTTDRRLAEEALWQAKQEAENERRKLESVLEALPIGVILSDANGEVFKINAVAKQLWGKKASDDADLDRLLQEGRWADSGKPLEKEDWPLAKALHERKTFSGIQIESDRSINPKATFLCSAAPLFDSESRVLGGLMTLTDITDIKTKESQLRSFAAVVQHSISFIAMFDLNYKTTLVNPAGCEMLGITEQQVKGKPFLDFFCPEDIPIIQAQALPHLEREEYWSGEVRLCHSISHELIHTAWNAFPIKDENGKVVGYATISPNLNNLKETQQALRKATLQAETQARELQAIFNSMTEVVIVSDAHANLLYMNPFALKLYGRGSMEEMPHHLDNITSNFELRAPNGNKLAPEQWPLIRLTNGEALSDFPLMLKRKATGEEIFLSVNGTSVRDANGLITLCVLTARDVTEQRRVELARAQTAAELFVARELAERRALEFEAVYKAIQDAVFVYGAEGALLNANSTAEKLLGVKAPCSQQSLARAVDERTLVDEDNKRMALEDLPFTLALRGENVQHRRFSLVTQAGQKLYLEASATPLWKNKQPIGAVAVWHDISALKANEEELRLARDSADKANRAKSTFLANISHEIRTPLSAIIGFADLLKDEAIEPELRKRYVNLVFTSGEQLELLINDLLDLAKAESGRLELEITPVSLEEVVSDAVALLAKKAADKGVILQFQKCDTLPETVWADRLRFKQIVINLIGNALKFTEKGGWVTVSLSYSSQDKMLSLRVSDSGIGIPDERWESIFEPFRQGDASMTRRFGGTGLGLAFSRRLARLMGGDLKLVFSKPNEGSVFEVMLPELSAPTEPSPIV